MKNKKRDYHTKCHDCGKFLKKDLWVAKNDKLKKHGLCAECHFNNDSKWD